MSDFDKYLGPGSVQTGPGSYELPNIKVGAVNYEPQVFGSGGGDDSDFAHSRIGQLINVATRTYILNTYPPVIAQNVRDQEANFAKKLQSMPTSITESIYSIAQSENSSESVAAQIEKHNRSVDTLIAQKAQAYAAQKAIGDKYYYGDFFRFPTSRFITNAISMGRTNYPPDRNYKEWYASLEAAYSAKYIGREIEYLGALKQKLQEQATQARANAEVEAQRAAAEVEAKRIANEAAAAEAAIVAAQVEAQRVAAEAAEQARLAAEAEAEAKRVVDEAARVAAETAAAAAAEQASLAAEAEAQRVAAEAAEQVRLAEVAEAKRITNEAAAAEAARVAVEAAALKAAHTFRLPAAGATQLSTAAGSIAITTGSGITLDAAIQAAKVALGTVVSAATAVGIGALTYSESLGNGELPATMLDLPAKDLAPNLPDNLHDIAAAGGTVDVPYRVYGDQSKYSVVATQTTGGVTSSVPVRALVLDPVANAYTFTTNDTPPITLTFPIAVPGESSTATPAKPLETPVYTGITLTPIEVKLEPFPIASQLSIRDGIYVYPADSGLPPIYAVFSSPYEGATTKGEHSGRLYNPDKAGGPTQDLDWTTASVTLEGIDLVKLHTGRFAPSDANKIMIDRLEKILSGHVPIADVDKRFYTHEIRELERYRALGVADGIAPDDRGVTWNNAHAATLEDYKLKDGEGLFYTPEAIEADRVQSEREAK
ncbi:S-type pyocin domain-containing protein [Pseudomonas sp. O39]|uniref:S-type pyocin domain-containing protein n=1 Tax=Pseudomonas sp. O39 TaxID=3379130 RepID=UPI00387AAF4C